MQVYFYDEEKHFTSTRLATDAELEFLENYTTVEVPAGLYLPKFDGEKWIEDESQAKIMQSMIVYDNKKMDLTDVFLALGAYMKGGEDMFFKILLNFWLEEKIDDKYLDNAVQFKLITKEESDFIKLTPRIEE